MIELWNVCTCSAGGLGDGWFVKIIELLINAFSGADRVLVS